MDPLRRSGLAVLHRRGAVLHYIERWLPRSEGFVHDVVTAVARPGVVVTPRTVENTDVFPFRPLVSLAPVADHVPLRWRQRAMTVSIGAVTARYGATLIHVHHGYRAHEVVNASRVFGLPLVVSLHGDDVTGSFWAKPELYRGVFEQVGAVIVPSRFLVDYAVAAGAPRDLVHPIPSGVDTTQFTPSPMPEGTADALFVGRFVDKKGLDVLAEAWPAVRAAVPGARLRVLGYGPLEAMARTVADEVVLHPDRPAVRQAIRDATVVVTPSRTAAGDAFESLLIVNLEAQASGRPVVTTDHGGIPEFVARDETALVVPENDPAALADALVRVLADRRLATRMGAAGPEWVAQFDVRDSARRLDRLYDKVTTGV